ncbi:MAG: hypothetical protein M1616_03770 [Candidatus Thermoplasmatota archaeon]|nr:hypothetical protein [Candidatus Thermoplasmatota archaeon]
MTMLSDLEIIRSSLIYGEPSIAMDLIERKTKKLKYIMRVSRKPRDDIRDHMAMLECFRQVINGAITVDEFKEQISRIPSFMKVLSPDQDISALENLSYTVQLSLDRYNIRYPEYDSKRCDDR